MSILLDTYSIPEKGRVDLKVERSFDINVSAEEARRLVNRWLLDEVSYLIGADTPTLVVSEQTVVWRVPVWIGFPHTGRAGIVGMVNVDVETGRMENTPACKSEIEHRATVLAEQQPPFQAKEVPTEYLAQNISSLPPVYTLVDGTMTLIIPTDQV